MSYETILLNEADGVVTLTLNRPDSLNALTPQMVRELNEALDELSRQGGARVLVMTGAGRAFSSGADLKCFDFDTEKPIDTGMFLEQSFNALIERLYALPVPIVTAVNGPTVGAGCSIALLGDMVVAARSAYFLLAFVNIGLIPDMGITWLLPRLIGRARANAMMMLGERVPAEQAEGWGMIYKSVDDAGLMDEAQEIAARLAKGPTACYRLIRQGLRDCMESSLTESLWIERINQKTASATGDFMEGVNAFLEKREAVFKGR